MPKVKVNSREILIVLGKSAPRFHEILSNARRVECLDHKGQEYNYEFPKETGPIDISNICNQLTKQLFFCLRCSEKYIYRPFRFKRYRRT